jgi:hypothetical protein
MSWAESARCADGQEELPKRPDLPTSEAPEKLGFRPRKKMIRWLSPKELAHTAMRVFLSSVFGAYSDKREIQAALGDDGPVRYDVHEQTGKPRQELWVDFVADLGDAFGPTYAVASLLAQPALDLGLPGGSPHATERGKVLVMGGDQVYPTASITGYNDRTLGPYRAALPYTKNPSDLYAIPGNHDWYDGLTSFMRVFCTRQWIGGWRTRQRRSYFALQLPHRWWIFGIDIQLESYIDEPQLRYFEEVVGPKLEEGDSIILCSAVPAWVKASEEGHAEAFATLDFFERRIVQKHKAVIRLALTGDAHHYARYTEDRGSAQKITAGGGGAFLAATHHLPDELHLPPAASRAIGKTTPPARYTLQHAYPSRGDSRRMRWRVASLPFKNGSMWALIGAVHLLYAWMIQSVLRAPTQDFSALMRGLSPAELAGGVVRSPLALLLGAAIVWGMAGFTKSKRWGKRAMGAAHGLTHVVLSVLTIYGASGLASTLDPGAFLPAFLVLVGVGGGLLGSWLLAGYLLVADRFRCNANELFAAQRGRFHKNFLRLHVEPDGALTVYPVKVERPPTHWRLRRTDGVLSAAGVQDDPWFEPVPPESLRAELIEEPIRIEPANEAPLPRRKEKVGSDSR